MPITSPARPGSLSRPDLSARSGDIAEVAHLVARWFPTQEIEVVETVSRQNSPDGWMHFDLFITLCANTYRKRQRYSTFCEGEIGRDIGQIETASEAREQLDAIIASEPAFDAVKHLAARLLVEAVPMFGWELVSTAIVSRLSYLEELRGKGNMGWIILDEKRQFICAAARLEQLRELQDGEVLARFF